MRRVIVESPYRADERANVEIHLRYLRAALHDCLTRGEAPVAFHGLLPQPGVLDVNIPAQRKHGIEAGFSWREVADATVVYTDFGITDGMKQGMRHAHSMRQDVELRQLVGWGPEDIPHEEFATRLWGDR